MSEKKKIFEPIGEYNSMSELLSTTQSFRYSLKELGIKFDTDDLINKIMKEKREYDNKYREIVNYIRQFFGKYVRLKFYYIAAKKCGTGEPTWICDYKYDVLLYQYIPSNQCLFGIYCLLDNIYEGGVKDTSIDLLKYVQGHRMEIEEITKEEFMNDVNSTTDKCLTNRLNRMESNNYTLTENGYTRTS